MPVVLGLLIAVLYGAGDFCGGISTKRTSVMNVIAFSHLAGLVCIAALSPFLAERFTWGDFVLGGLGGLAGVVGIALLYQGLAQGPMAVVAPLAAITSASVPAAWGILDGETFSGLTWLGILVALVAIVLVSLPSEFGEAPVTLLTIVRALGAGVGFGVIFIVFDATDEATAPWPVVGARVATTALLLGIVLVARRPEIPTARPVALPILGAGLFDTASNALFLYAVQVGSLTVVSVLTSLYPASTVLLARIVLGERMSRLQVGGLAAALVGAALIANG